MMDMYVIGTPSPGDNDDEALATAAVNGDYTPMYYGGTHTLNARPLTYQGWAKWAWHMAFLSQGHITEESRKHVGFVAEVIASLMETAIFAYLGLFLFNDKDGNLTNMGTGVFACVSSRAAMVLVLCALINIGVFFDLERRLSQMVLSWRHGRNRQASFYTLDDVDRMSSQKYLDPKTQFILFTAGVRGAVSYALVQNIPVYDTVTKHGSHFKGELRAMTSATIVGLLFVFGALTYYAVEGNQRSRRRVNNNLGTDELTETLVSHPTEYDPPFPTMQPTADQQQYDLHLNDTSYSQQEASLSAAQRFN
jgi:hypothetical protein